MDTLEQRLNALPSVKKDALLGYLCTIVQHGYDHLHRYDDAIPRTEPAVHALLLLKDPRAVGPLIRLVQRQILSDRYTHNISKASKMMAIHALGEIGRPEAAPFLTAVLAGNGAFLGGGLFGGSYPYRYGDEITVTIALCRCAAASDKKAVRQIVAAIRRFRGHSISNLVKFEGLPEDFLREKFGLRPDEMP